MSVDAMPERYTPDPHTDHTVGGDERHSTTPYLNLTTLAVRDWIGCTGGEVLSIAPRGPQSVRVGIGVPTILGTVEVSRDGRHDTIQLDTKLPLDALEYMNVEPGDTVRLHNADADREIVVERVEVDA